MALEVKGIDDISRTYKNLGKDGDKVAKNDVKKTKKQP